MSKNMASRHQKFVNSKTKKSNFEVSTTVQITDGNLDEDSVDPTFMTQKDANVSKSYVLSFNQVQTQEAEASLNQASEFNDIYESRDELVARTSSKFKNIASKNVFNEKKQNELEKSIRE